LCGAQRRSSASAPSTLVACVWLRVPTARCRSSCRSGTLLGRSASAPSPSRTSGARRWDARLCCGSVPVACVQRAVASPRACGRG
jgi:hypothetical protein